MSRAEPEQSVGSIRDHTIAGLSWREAGSGPPVIFLHGLGGTRGAWGSQLRGLSATFRCVAWDMPGYGHAAPLTPLTYERIAARVADLIDALDIEQADLVGLSFGGMHALHTAIHFPTRVRRLVLANTSPAFGMDGTSRQAWIDDRLTPLANGGTPADGAERVVDLLAAAPLTGRIREETVACFDEISVEGFRAAVECLPDNDVRAQLSHIDHRSLVVAGEMDRETPPSYAKVLHAGLAHSRLEVLADIGHLSPAEAPKRFNKLVSEFLTAP